MYNYRLVPQPKIYATSHKIFLPSITKPMLDKIIFFGQEQIKIIPSEIRIVKHSQLSLSRRCVDKKEGTFDVTEGSFDGADAILYV